MATNSKLKFYIRPNTGATQSEAPFLGKIVGGLASVVTAIGGIIALLGAIIIMFIFSQMFDDKHTYDSGSNIVDFINWFADGAKDTAKATEKYMLDEEETSNETEAVCTGVVESNQTRTAICVGND